MRFELLEWDKRINFLQRTHKRLNRELFNGELSDVLIDVRNLNKNPYSEPCCAMYCVADAFQPERILFDTAFVFDGFPQLKNQTQQAYVIIKILLHEMIHQYCAAKGLPQEGKDEHGKEWQQAAEEHGLHSVYDDNGDIVEEWLLPVSQMTAYMTRIH